MTDRTFGSAKLTQAQVEEYINGTDHLTNDAKDAILEYYAWQSDEKDKKRALATAGITLPIPVGTLATRDILDALPSGSVVATYGNPYMKGDDGWWGTLLTPGGKDVLPPGLDPHERYHPDLHGNPQAAVGAKWRDLDYMVKVAYFVIYDSTEAWKRTGAFDKETYNTHMEAKKEADAV